MPFKCYFSQCLKYHLCHCLSCITVPTVQPLFIALGIFLNQKLFLALHVNLCGLYFHFHNTGVTQETKYDEVGCAVAEEVDEETLNSVKKPPMRSKHSEDISFGYKLLQPCFTGEAVCRRVIR